MQLSEASKALSVAYNLCIAMPVVWSVTRAESFVWSVYTCVGGLSLWVSGQCIPGLPAD